MGLERDVKEDTRMNRKYDVIVIGTGPAGKYIAKETSKQGLNVATIEANGYGGTCPNHGCTPKKMLSSVSAKVAEANRLVGRGVQHETAINWEDLIARKRMFIDPIPEENEQQLKERGVTTYHGYASFVSKNEVILNNETLYGDKIIIATGAKPVDLPIDGIENLMMSDGFLELDELPRQIIFVGGGYISFEFAHIAARAGSQVTILEGSDEALGEFDPELTDHLLKYSKEIGIDVHLDTMVNAIKKNDGTFYVKGERNDEQVEWKADLVIHGAGRVPHIDQLNLDVADVKYDKEGIIVNTEQQSTTNPNIYVAGDVAKTEGPPLTPVAHLQAELVVDHLFNRHPQPIDYAGIPSVAFTTPKLAMVGMSEKEAKESDKEIDIKRSEMTDWFMYRHLNEPVAEAKIIIDTETNQILGAHILADEADQLINYFAAAMQLNLTADQLKGVIYAFPTPFSNLSKML